MIGAAVLVIGLLLILTGLASARIPGGATFTPSGIARAQAAGEDTTSGLFAFARRAGNPLRAFLLAPIHPATWYANAAIILGLFTGLFAFVLLAAIASGGFSTIVFGAGFILIALAIEGSRVAARAERWRAFIGESVRPRAHPYRPLKGSLMDIAKAEFADESRWRDVLYVVVNLPLTILEFVVVTTVWVVALFFLTTPIWYDAVPAASLPSIFDSVASRDVPLAVLRTAFGLALLPVAASLSQVVMALHRAVVTGLLCTSESRELRRQVAELRESRSAVMDVEASELHRIERDLHDGAQQRLVMLSIDLGLAGERVDSDPAAAKQLILEGQEQARQALAEIRDLVRGIAPSILLDRGLRAALDSISGRGPVPTVVISNLASGERLPPAVERAAYFVATEGLANVAKHSGASRCEVRCQREPQRLVIEVWDDGTGGARLEPGGGLAGLENRISGVDGVFSLASPPGGPTTVRAEIPLAPPAPADHWVRS